MTLTSAKTCCLISDATQDRHVVPENELSDSEAEDDRKHAFDYGKEARDEAVRRRSRVFLSDKQSPAVLSPSHSISIMAHDKGDFVTSPKQSSASLSMHISNERVEDEEGMQGEANSPSYTANPDGVDGTIQQLTEEEESIIDDMNREADSHSPMHE